MTGEEPRTPDSPPDRPGPDWNEHQQRQWAFANWMHILVADVEWFWPNVAIRKAPPHLRQYLNDRNLQGR